MAEVARALGVADGDRTGNAAVDRLDRLVDALGGRRALVVLDNCEHVIDEAAELVVTLLAHCPGLYVLATSREPLAVPGEVSWAIPPLARDEALDLLAARAAAVRSDFTIRPEEEALAVQLVERLDGLPLAIELAAARLRSLTLVDITARLDDRFSLLTGSGRGIEPRQQTLRRLVDWSHDLLEPAEQVVFRRLAAFSGGATLDAAEVVCADPSPDPAPSPPATWPTSSAASSTSRSCSPTTGPTACATACCRPCRTTPTPASSRPGRPRPPACGTPSTSPPSSPRSSVASWVGSRPTGWPASAPSGPTSPQPSSTPSRSTAPTSPSASSPRWAGASSSPGTRRPEPI